MKIVKYIYAECLMEVKGEYQAEMEEMNMDLKEQIRIGLRGVKEIINEKTPAYTMRDLFGE